MKSNLSAAVSFTDALQNMEKTWGGELESIPLLKEYLEGCAAIAAAATVYMGNFPYDEQVYSFAKLFSRLINSRRVSH